MSDHTNILNQGTREEKLDLLKEVLNGFEAIPIETIRHFMKCETDEYILATLISCFGRICNRASATELLPFLTHQDSRVRANAVDVLRFLDNPETYEFVAMLLNDENPRVRANAARFYKETDLEKYLDVLEKMLDSNDPGQVRSARFSLFWIRNDRAKTLLQRAEVLLKSFE